MQSLNPSHISDYHIRQLQELLDKTQRNEPSSYGVFEEYPLLFKDTQSLLKNSLIKIINDKVIGHLNFFQRSIIDTLGNEKANIALIGNVSTEESFRRTGVMQELLSKAKAKANSLKLSGLVLWTENPSIYTKQGFEPIGKEFHYYFERQNFQSHDLINEHQKSYISYLLTKERAASVLLSALLRLRPIPPFTAKRTTEEFKTLLEIPDTYCVVAQNKKSEIVGYAIIGRGQDFAGVIHEWGFANQDAFLYLTRTIFEITELDRITFLTPKPLEECFSENDLILKLRCQREETAMALGYILDSQKKNIFDRLFIWGLDSI